MGPVHDGFGFLRFGEKGVYERPEGLLIVMGEHLRKRGVGWAGVGDGVWKESYWNERIGETLFQRCENFVNSCQGLTRLFSI